MKVLYVAEGRTSEYQGDMLFHGLRSILGSDCVDANRMWQMYANSFGDGKRSLSECWGRGFTLYGLLPDDSDVDRSDLREKIASRYFDIVVYSLIYPDRSYLADILAAYPASRIAFIDGGDSPDLLPERGQGVYFKRELASDDPDLVPIQFGIPKEKIRRIDSRAKGNPPQDFLMSSHVPWETGHTYDREEDYYADYGRSLFALTKKKGGWDCLRHYEIIAAGCVPYFIGLDDCPASTLALFDRGLFRRAREMHDSWATDWGNARFYEWAELAVEMQERLKIYLTTESLATRVLERMT